MSNEDYIPQNLTAFAAPTLNFNTSTVSARRQIQRVRRNDNEPAQRLRMDAVLGAVAHHRLAAGTIVNRFHHDYCRLPLRAQSATNEASDHFKAEFRKMGLDAVRFETQRKNGGSTAVGAKPPADFLVTPAAPGDPEKIEVPAVFLNNLQPFGGCSPIYTATVAP